MSIKVELLTNGIVPTRKTAGAAAYDLFTPFPLALSEGLHKVDLRIKIELPRGTFGSIRCRSSLALKGLSVEAGVIDEDYRGILQVLLRVRSEHGILLPKGHAIAQLIVQPYLAPEVEVVTLTQTVRGENGFGSTNKS